MFFLKKILTPFFVPPGIFVTILVIISLFSRKNTRRLSIFLAILLYIFSIEPTKDAFLKPLEDAHPFPLLDEIRTCQAYVVLGATVREGVPELSGKGELSEEGYQRAVTAYRLYRIEKKSIILTGGSVSKRDEYSPYAKRFLSSLGVEGSDIILETRSRDTYENAKYTKDIAERLGIKKILLITNAYHMKRSYVLFSQYFDVIPFPLGYKTSKRPYDLISFLPDASNLEGVACAIKEYLGLFYYLVLLKR
ncbi:MAG: YdcF family protein [Deltaproteobacteria bacterium]|nr:YdcF family protein [Deltaproteobacteria bacterium]